MWDTKIRTKLKQYERKRKNCLKIGNGEDGKKYLEFLKHIKNEINKLIETCGGRNKLINRVEKKRKFISLAKSFDEYLYAKYKL